MYGKCGLVPYKKGQKVEIDHDEDFVEREVRVVRRILRESRLPW